MRSSFLFIFTLFILSCKKDHPGNETPKGSETGYSKLKKITVTGEYRGNTYGISYEITTDSINNKIIVKTIQYGDTLTGIYSYNRYNQLELYEATSRKGTLYISRMNFIRNDNGKLIKVLSEYFNNGIIEKSESIFQYKQVRDTSFVTFIDTANKQKAWLREFYTIGMINNRIVSKMENQYAWDLTYTPIRYNYTYGGSNNLISYTETLGNSPAVVFKQKRGSLSPKELKKFFSRLGGDIPWFYRATGYGFINFQNTLPFYYLRGNVLEGMKQENTTWEFINEFDSVGNLKKITNIETPAYPFSTPTTYDFEYWP